MIVLNKKKIILVSSSIFLAIFIFMLTSSNLGGKNNYVETVSLPVSGKTIVIDAGHGVPDERSCLLTLKITLIFYKK